MQLCGYTGWKKTPQTDAGRTLSMREPNSCSMAEFPPYFKAALLISASGIRSIYKIFLGSWEEDAISC